ncbi:hypothetical protein ACOI1C_10160 [Bacillus sp. DJP31]|uniref:hypothetical protein n=1 Tax=Bacillus sp. DJP31 TaxID=3409789 RepID=UPI003BB507AB
MLSLTHLELSIDEHIVTILLHFVYIIKLLLLESVQKGGQKEQRSSRKRSLELPARMFCIREERRDELTK